MAEDGAHLVHRRREERFESLLKGFKVPTPQESRNFHRACRSTGREPKCAIVNNQRRIDSGNSGNPCMHTGANNDGASRSDSRASTHSAADATEP